MIKLKRFSTTKYYAVGIVLNTAGYLVIIEDYGMDSESNLKERFNGILKNYQELDKGNKYLSSLTKLFDNKSDMRKYANSLSGAAYNTDNLSVSSIKSLLGKYKTNRNIYNITYIEKLIDEYDENKEDYKINKSKSSELQSKIDSAIKDESDGYCVFWSYSPYGKYLYISTKKYFELAKSMNESGVSKTELVKDGYDDYKSAKKDYPEAKKYTHN